MGNIFKTLGKAKRDNKTEQNRADDSFDEAVSDTDTDDYFDEVIQDSDDSSAATTSGEEEIETYYIDPALVTGLEPQSVEAEQFRLLKNNILFPEKGKPPRSIMVTSFSPSEGKSFVAANLAISIAQNIDEYVLLLDCDLRSPSIHPMFGLANGPGLSEYLSENRPLQSLLVKTFLDKLTILPAGEIPANPSELLSSDRMKRLISEIKKRYADRYIIFDTSPPYLTSETNAISRQVDGIVIVVQQGKTRKQDVMNLIDIYGKEKILGVVYNFAKRPIGYGYGKYGHNQYGYGRK